MAGKKGSKALVKAEETTVLKTYRDHSGNTIYHYPNHERCRGTGFLTMYYIVAMEEGERWVSRAWDCSCRNEVTGRFSFDRHNHQFVGMTQDELDAEYFRARYTDEEQAKINGEISRVLSLPVGKRLGAIMDIVKPMPREVPAVKVIE